MYAQRRAERAHSRYAALNDHPNFWAFGRAEYVDAAGREYTLGPVDADGRTRRLNVRLPRPDVLPPDPLEERLRVTSTDGNGRAVVWQVKNVTWTGPKRRTGHVTVFIA
jgi:hypothetical protein